MRIPDLNRHLVLEGKTLVPDGAGGQSEIWTALGTLWGEVVPRTGRETSGEAGAVSLTGFRITVRGAPVGQSNRPVAGQRFRLGTRILAILSVTEAAGLDRYLTCIAEEEVSP